MSMDYYNVVVPQGDNPTDAQVRAGQQSDGSLAAFSFGLPSVANGVLFIADATGLTNHTDYTTIVVVDDPVYTLRGGASFRTGTSSIARTYVEQFEDVDGKPVVVGWSK